MHGIFTSIPLQGARYSFQLRSLLSSTLLAVMLLVPVGTWRYKNIHMFTVVFTVSSLCVNTVQSYHVHRKGTVFVKIIAVATAGRRECRTSRSYLQRLIAQSHQSSPTVCVYRTTYVHTSSSERRRSFHVMSPPSFRLFLFICFCCSRQLRQMLIDKQRDLVAVHGLSQNKVGGNYF